MNDNQINAALAVAIGYKQEDVRVAPDATNVVEVNRPTAYGDSWYRLDFTCPSVIWPIAERYGMFPYPLKNKDGCLTGEWNTFSRNGWEATAGSAAASSALAVIGRQEDGKL